MTSSVFRRYISRFTNNRWKCHATIWYTWRRDRSKWWLLKTTEFIESIVALQFPIALSFRTCSKMPSGNAIKRKGQHKWSISEWNIFITGLRPRPYGMAALTGTLYLARYRTIATLLQFGTNLMPLFASVTWSSKCNSSSSQCYCCFTFVHMYLQHHHVSNLIPTRDLFDPKSIKVSMLLMRSMPVTLPKSNQLSSSLRTQIKMKNVWCNKANYKCIVPYISHVLYNIMIYDIILLMIPLICF